MQRLHKSTHPAISKCFRYFLLLPLLAALFLNNNTYAQNAVSPGTIPVNPPVAGFGMDGDLKANVPASGIGDWLPNSAASGGVLSSTGVAPTTNPQRTFHREDSYTTGDNTLNGGLKKNGDLNTYTWKSAKTNPVKCDINNLLVHIAEAYASPAYGLAGDTWITLAGDRESTNGNSFISIALLQEKLIDSSNGKFYSDAPSSTGGRTLGDVQISAEFTAGGTTPNLYLEEWKFADGAWKWVSRPILLYEAFGSVNTVKLTGVPYRAFGNTEAGSTWFYPINSFIEVSFNISAIYRGINPCIGSIASMFVMTKSSQSVTADLSDFVSPLQINLDLTVGQPTAASATYCMEQTILALTASGETGAVFNWYNNPDTTASGAHVDSDNSYTPPQTINATAGTYTYYVTQAIKGCQSDTTQVHVVINPLPTAVAGTAPAAQCYNANGNAFALGAGTTPASTSNGTRLWTVQSIPSGMSASFSGTGSSLDGTSSTSLTPTVNVSGGSGTVTLRLTVTSNFTPSCGTPYDDVIVTVNPNPTAVAGTAPAAQCYIAAGNPFTLGTGTIPASTSNGTLLWTVQSTSSGMSASFSGTGSSLDGTSSTSLTPTVNVSGGSGTVTLRLTVTSSFTPACSAATSDVTVTVNPNPTAVAGTAPAAQCYNANGNAFTLGAGTIPASTSNGTRLWTVQSTSSGMSANFGGSTSSSSLTPTVNVSSGTGGGTVTLRLTVTSNFTPSCGTPYDDVTVTVNPNPTAVAGTAPAAQCYIAAGNSFTLGTGTIPASTSNGTLLWTVQSTSSGMGANFGGSISSSSLTPTVNVSSGTGGGTVTLLLTVTSGYNPVCTAATSTVTVTVSAQVGGPSSTVLAITCSSLSFRVQVTNPVGGTTYHVTQPGSTYDSTKTYSGSGNLIFAGLTFGAGYNIVASVGNCSSAPDNCAAATRPLIAKTDGAPQSLAKQAIKLESAGTTKVVAAPNPFNDRVRFSLQSAISGQGSLDLFNMVGQRVHRVYQGYIEKGQTKVLDYNVAGAKRGNLIYVFQVGDQKVTGTLINLK